MIKRILLVVCIFLVSKSLLFSQQLLIPLNRDVNIPFENRFNQKQINIHTICKPYLISDISRVFNPDSLVYKERKKSFSKKYKNTIWRKLRKENLIIADTSDFYLTADPVFNFEIGKNMISDSLAYVNTRGFLVQGNLGTKLSFSTSFYENQAGFVNYISEYVQENHVVPGQGPVKSFKTSDFDYSSASAYISYLPIQRLQIQLGHGKHFFGEGYRSLLLSDNAFYYPYLKLTTQFWNIQYVSLYTSFINNVSGTFTSELKKKYASFHFLSYNICSRLNISLFESIIWQSEINQKKKNYSVEYLNPLIFYNSATYNLNDTNNVMIGINFKYKLFNKFSVYSQLAVDDLNYKKLNYKQGSINNKIAYQVGIKGFDIFRLRNLNMILEYNQARPYTYAIGSTQQNYSHYNQSLAHPLGANFKETVGIMNYRYKDFLVEVKFNYALYGADSLKTNYGKNIFYSDITATNGLNSDGNNMLQGIKTTMFMKDFRIYYLVNPATNMNILLGVSDREEKSAITDQHSLYIYVGFRTALTNYYYDF